MADDMRLLMHPDVRHKISDEAIQAVSERAPSDSEESVEVTTTRQTKSVRKASKLDGDIGSDITGDGSDGSDTGSVSDASSRSVASVPAPSTPKRPSYKSLLAEKHDLLFKINRLLTRGGKPTRPMTASDSIEELRAEFERMQREIDTENSVRFQRSVLTSFATGVECLNSRFDVAGIRLDGWSESLNQDITSFDEIFEELHEKYGGKSMMPPEIKLVFMVASSAFMFHMSKSMFSSMPGLQEAMKDDPELAKAFAASVARKASQNESSRADQRGAASMFANIMGAGVRGAPRGKPMSAPDDDSLDNVEQLFSDSESGSSSSSTTSSSGSRRSRKSAKQSKSEFILDA